MREKSGFTLVEVLIAATISVVVAGIVVGVIFFFARTWNYEIKQMNIKMGIDSIISEMFHDFLMTARRDPYDNLKTPLREVDSNHKYVVFQILSPCSPGSNEVIDTTAKVGCWGDGINVGYYVRFIEDNGNLYRERWTGLPGNSTLVERRLLLPDVDFSVVGLDSTGFVEKTTRPIVLQISIASKVIDYKKTIQIKLRGA